jgi:fructose-bisphosphate aldolase class 1
MMCAVALESVCWLHEKGVLRVGDVERWRRERERIREFVETRCYSERTKSYVRAVGEEELDASLLLGVLAGYDAPRQASVDDVAAMTIRCLRHHVPAAVPGIVFLSGGQSDELATEHLDAINRLGPHPWAISFSYGRALQDAAQRAWSGSPQNVQAAQRAFAHRARMNGLARDGRWSRELEQQAASVY